ncbi:MAG: DUF2630 family protein [Geodermatophilaceae bacterium]|nr:DUF2630 family protein [Geodermatophilaceae bacterium]MDQ3454244.1 DUF2630 family protein [Actinomycetota bacterium]
MDDSDIRNRITALVEEEHRLRQNPDGLSPEDQTRLEGLEVGLDQLWDQLRQREALRRAGTDPDQARQRPAREVEGYLQ